jgi:hypothetical protein
LRTQLDDGSFAHAVGWADKKGKAYIFNFSNTLPGNPCVKKRSRTIFDAPSDTFVPVPYTFTVKRPKVVEMIQNNLAAIDIHDHYRQGSLQVERRWKTTQ